MKVLVPVKRVVDYNVKVRVKSDGTGVDIANVKMSMNPFDEIAVEEAVRLKEKGVATEIVAVSMRRRRSARKRCAPRWPWAPTARILVETDDELQPLAVAKLLKALVDKEQPQLVILGKQAIDDDSNQTGQMLAALLRLAAGDVRLEGRVLTATASPSPAKSTAARRPLTLTLPAVVTTDLRLNEPRYVSLPNIMKAKKKPLDDR